MERASIFLLILFTLVILSVFTFGFLYISKRIKQKKNMALTVLLPLAASFIVGIALLVFAFSTI